MKSIEQTNYVLVSPNNPHYLFALKQPQLIACSGNYFDQTSFLVLCEGSQQLYPMAYYHLQYKKVDKMFIKIIKATPVAAVGKEWNSQLFLEHMRACQGTLKQPEGNSKFMKEVLERGELRVNDEGWIYVKSCQSGFRKKLKIVNNPFPLPLLKGCKVEFFLRKYAQTEGPKVKISALHFRPLKLAGILKMINGRIFFQPRHTDYDRMVPLTIPEPLMDILYECMPDYRLSLPYTIFKRYDGDHELVNKKLSAYVLEGKFVDWPLKFSHPVIEIESMEPMSCTNLKNATLYQLGIPLLDYDSQQNALSQIIIYKFKAEQYLDRERITDICYSFDCQGSSCHDDAFSFKKTQCGYKIGIHISDVPELVSGYPYLLKKALSRDQTIYIKNYYRSMFPEQLRNIMSLVEDRYRLAYSLFFNINKNGQINYPSITFKESVIKVNSNLIHGDIVPKKDDRQVINEFKEILSKCKDLDKLMLFDEAGTAAMTNELLFLSAYLPMLTFEHNLNNIESIVQATKNYLKCVCKKVQEFQCNYKENSVQQAVACEQQKQCEKVTPERKSIEKCDIIEIAEEVQEECLKQIELTKSPSSMEYLRDTESNGSVDSDTFSESEEKEVGKKIPMFTAKNIGIEKNQFFRKVSSKEGSAAECYRFLDKLFRAAKLDVDFSNPKNIENAFKQCEKKYNDKIVELYFRTKLIMSRQHFDVIGRLAKQGKLKNFELDNTQFKYPSDLEKKESSDTKVQPDQEVNCCKYKQICIPNKITTECKQCPTKNKQTKEEQKKSQENTKCPLKQLKVEEQMKEEHEVSFIWNTLKFIEQKELTCFTTFTKCQLSQKIIQFETYAKQNKIELIENTLEQSEETFNAAIMKSVCCKEWIPKQSRLTMKWNTPIRSGASLEAISLIKNHSWIFEGSPKPSTAIFKHKQARAIKEQIQHLISQKEQQQCVQLNGRMKEAVRELGKIDFLFVLRQQPDKVWDFITITSPSHRVQFVYHEFIEEVEVDNPQKDIIYYSRVKGRFKGIFDFPIKLKVVLEN